jgi:uncharacterized Zn-binding protein involved in type VI secretion
MSEIIRMGDPTSHGGTVIEGSEFDICHGKPIAFIGHKTYCPRCKGSFAIIDGAMTMTFYGRGVALAGMKTACGATLIATQFTDFVEYGSGSEGSKKSAASNRGSATATSRQDNRNANDQEYDIHFYITDAADLPMMDWPYCIETASGKRVEGRTDNQGKTIRIASALAECARLHVYEQDVTPIDANWDRHDESEAHR